MRMIVGLTLCGLVLFPAFVFAAEESLAGRVTALEEALSHGVVQQVQISGAIEAEVGYSSDYDDVKESDVDLTTLELGIDVALNEFFSGFALMKWEEDGDEGVFLDEGGVVLGNVDEYGVAVTAGKLYVPPSAGRCSGRGQRHGGRRPTWHWDATRQWCAPASKVPSRCHATWETPAGRESLPRPWRLRARLRARAIRRSNGCARRVIRAAA